MKKPNEDDTFLTDIALEVSMGRGHAWITAGWDTNSQYPIEKPQSSGERAVKCFLREIANEKKNDGN